MLTYGEPNSNVLDYIRYIVLYSDVEHLL